MKIDISKSLNKNIDRSKWKKYYFSDFAENIVEKIVPKKSGLEHYIGLEHLDAGSLKIRRFGETKSLIGDKLKIYKGDLIFAKRNAYLKRVAVAEFDAVASAHSMVLRPKSELVLPEFLPFFMLSDKFWNKAIEISVGSLSPTINWKALAKQEFLLPPKQDQTKLAKLLWAADNVVENDKELLEKSEKAMTSLFINSIFKKSDSLNEHFGKLNPLFEVIKLFKVIFEFQYGISESLNEKAIGIPILRMNNLLNGSIVLEDLKYFSPKGKELDDFILNKGDVLFNRTNSFELVGKVGLFDADLKCSFASYLIRLKTNRDLLDPRFLNYYLNSSIGLRKIRKYRTPGVSQSNINASYLKNVPIPMPKIEFQKELMDKIELLEFTYKQSLSKLQSSQALLKSLINEVFV